MKEEIRKVFVKLKIWFTRAGIYLSLINTFLLIYIAISNKTQVQTRYIPLIFIGVICLILLVGFLDDTLGIWRIENKEVFDRMPQIQEILDILREKK